MPPDFSSMSSDCKQQSLYSFLFWKVLADIWTEFQFSFFFSYLKCALISHKKFSIQNKVILIGLSFFRNNNTQSKTFCKMWFWTSLRTKINIPWKQRLLSVLNFDGNCRTAYWKVGAGISKNKAEFKHSGCTCQEKAWKMGLINQRQCPRALFKVKVKLLELNKQHLE